MKLETKKFFNRVCDALGFANVYGVKTKIADELDISSSAVGLWEKGEVPGTDALKNVLKVAESSGTSIHWLLTGEGEKFVNEKKPISFDEILENKIRGIVCEELLKNGLQPVENLGKFGGTPDEYESPKDKKKKTA